MRHFDKVDFTGEISTCDRVDGICDALSRPLIANAELSEPLPSRTRYGLFSLGHLQRVNGRSILPGFSPCALGAGQHVVA
jgi:hypothetical protein